MNRRLIIAIVAILAGLALAGVIAAVVAPAELNRPVMITVAAAMTYIVWMIAFFLLIEDWLCRFTGWIFSVSLTREFKYFGGSLANRSLLDVLTISSWKVVGTSSLSLRFLVGLIRISFTLVAAMVPIALGLILYFGLIVRPPK